MLRTYDVAPMYQTDSGNFFAFYIFNIAEARTQDSFVAQLSQYDNYLKLLCPLCLVDSCS